MSLTRRSAILILILATILVFGQTVGFGFIDIDDTINIYKNRFFNPPTWANVLEFWKGPFEGLYIPVTYGIWGLLAFAAYHEQPLTGDAQELFHSPWVFHLANILVHTLNVVLVFGILRRLLESQYGNLRRASEPTQICAAAAGALVFAVHPIQVQAVSYITMMKDLGSSCFGLLMIRSLTQIRNGGRWGQWVLPGVWYLLAMLAKPSAIVLPILAAVLAPWLLDPSQTVTFFVRLLPAVVLSSLIIAINKSHQPDSRIPFLAPLWIRPLIAGDSIVFYLWKLLLPYPLSPDYGRRSQWLIEKGWPYLTGPLAMGGGALLWLKKDLRPLIVPALIAIVAVLPVLGFIPFNFQEVSNVSDHYLYLGMLGPALGVGWLFVKFDFVSRPRRLLGFGTVLLLWAALSALQARNWKDTPTLLTHTLLHNPDSYIANNNYGVYLAKKDQFEQALVHFRRALAVYPNNHSAHTNVGNALSHLEKLPEAIEEYSQALRLSPSSVSAHNGIGVALAQTGRLDQGVEHFLAALEIEPENAAAHNNMGKAYLERGRFREAEKEFLSALQFNPRFEEAKENLGVVRAKLR